MGSLQTKKNKTDVNKNETLAEEIEIPENKNALSPDSNRSNWVEKKRYSFENIYFVPDKAIIENLSISDVDEIAAVLKKYPNNKFEIRGHVNIPLWYKGKKDTIHLGRMQTLSVQ